MPSRSAKIQSPGVYAVYKARGLTPLDVIEHLKAAQPELQPVKIGYAGRLDPMAEGLLLLMVGEANKQRDVYQKLDKTYILSVMFGVATDSYDVLGLINETAVYSDEEVSLSRVEACLHEFEGDIEQHYPPYSAKRVDGKPLYYWALRDQLPGIAIPTEKRHVYSAEIKSFRYEPNDALQKEIIEAISQVRGDFRQEATLQAWRKYFSETSQTHHALAELEIDCSSGTYMRGIAHDLGKTLGVPACAFNIVRTRIGPHSKPDLHLAPHSRA